MKKYVNVKIVLLLVMSIILSNAHYVKADAAKDISNYYLEWTNSNLQNKGILEVHSLAGEYRPNFRVYESEDKNVKLIENEDYKYEFKNNDAFGTATLIVTGINDYSGTLVKNFVIKKSVDEDEDDSSTNEVSLKSQILLINSYVLLCPTSPWNGAMDKKNSSSLYEGELGFFGYLDKKPRYADIPELNEYPTRNTKELKKTLNDLSRFLVDDEDANKVTFESEDNKIFQVSYKNGKYKGTPKNSGVTNLIIRKEGKQVASVKVFNYPEVKRWGAMTEHYNEDFHVYMKKKGKYIYVKIKLSGWRGNSQLVVHYTLNGKSKSKMIKNGGILKFKSNQKFSFDLPSQLRTRITDSDLNFNKRYKYMYVMEFLELKKISEFSLKPGKANKIPKKWTSIYNKKVKKNLTIIK